MIILLVDSRVHADRSVHRSSHFMQSTNTWWCMVIRGVDRSLWLILLKPWNDRFGILPYPKMGYMTSWLLCTSLSLSLSPSPSLHFTGVSSFLRRSFCACLIMQVCYRSTGQLAFSAPFGNCMHASYSAILMSAFMLASIKIASN